MKLTLVFLLLYVALPPSTSFKSSGNSPERDESSLSPAVSEESSLSPDVREESSPSQSSPSPAVSDESSPSPGVSNESSPSPDVSDEYESRSSPAVSDESSLSPCVRDESSLSFEWTGPRSLRVTNRDGDEDDIKLRPAPGIGGVQVDCLFTGYLVVDLGSSAGVVGCQHSEQVEIIIVSNYSTGTMFTLINENKTTVELMDSSIDELLDPFIDAVYGEEEPVRRRRSVYYDEYEVLYEDDDLEFSGAPIPPNLFYKFQLAYDDALLTKMNKNKTATEEYLRNAATLAQTLFKKASLNTNIHFVINPKIKYLEGKEFQVDPYTNPQGKSTMKDAQAMENEEPLIIFTHTDDSESWRGVAPRRGACSATNARAIVKHRRELQRAALTMAHEMGHLYGNYHDGSKNEHPSCIHQGIMTDNTTNRPKEWSRCSKERLLRWYSRQGKQCLETAPECDNTAWNGTCSCGVGVNTNLCTSQDEGYCLPSTATCMVMETKLRTCQSFSSTAGDLLESGCQQPQELENGLIVCPQDGKTCHIHCDPSYTLNTSSPHRFIECLNSRWTHQPTDFNCVPDCNNYRGKFDPDCKGGRMLNPVVLLTGGTGVENSVEVFSPWQSEYCNKDLEDIPDDRKFHTIHFFKGKVIMCGGRRTRKNCLYLDQNQRFVPHSELMVPRDDHVGAVVKDKLLLVGGENSNLMESWDGSQWVQEGKLDHIKDQKKNSCAASINKDTILMAGGYNQNSKFTNKMFKYKVGVWERMEDFPGPAKGAHGCAFIQTPEGDAFLIAGGVDEKYLRPSSYLYNIEKREWEEVGGLAIARTTAKMLVVDGRVIMVGGYGGILEVEEYNVETKTWTIIQQKIKRGRSHFAAVVIPGALVGC